MTNERMERRRRSFSPTEQKERLDALVRKRGRLAPEDAALLYDIFPVIIALYHDQVWGQLRRRGIPEGDVEDLVQEAFLAAALWIRENGFPDTLPALLRTVTTGVMLNYLRIKNRSPISLGMPSSGSLPAVSEPERERVLDLRRVGVLLLDALSPDHRAVFVAIAVQRLTYEEASTLLGISLGTLKDRLLSAKKKVLKHIEQLLPPSQRGVP
jgi:RNA polymerase sigma-70 factor (ECF subfamily)